jgi:glucokinase
MKTAIGIDVGGTNTRVALVSDSMELLSRVQFPTNTRDPQAVMDELAKKVADLRRDDTQGIGISCPGPLDLKKGEIIVTPNLDKSWFGFPITRTLSEATGLPVILENDANLAALAEAVAGDGRRYSHVQFLTVSTGIGAGFVVDKKIYQGAHGFAGEVASVCMWQNGPAAGVVAPGGIEAIASGTAITTRAHQAGLEAAHAGQVADLARRGNPRARQIMDEALDYLANFVGALIAINDPDIVIFGGSVALKTPGFLQALTERVQAKALPAVRPYINLALTTLNEDSGLLGAAYLGMQA